MAIVRSLLISIGFKVDSDDIKETEKSITSFTARLTASFTILKFFAKRIVGFFSDIADAIINSSFLAKRLGVTLKEISALESAGLNFGLDKKTLQNSLSVANKLLEDFRTGANNKLIKISEGERFKFQIFEEDTGLTIFFKILEGLKRINNEADRIRIAGEIFGTASENLLSDLSHKVDLFKELVQENLKSNSLVESDKQAVEFRRSLDRLSDAFDKFLNVLSFTIFPILTEIFLTISFIAEFLRGLFKPTFATIGNIGKKFTENSVVGQGLQAVGLSFNDGLFDVSDRFRDLNSQVVVNNSINVPEGTTQEMSATIQNNFEQMVGEKIYKILRKIAIDNPLAES